VAKRCILGL